MSHHFDNSDLELCLDEIAELSAMPLDLADMEEITDLGPDFDSLIVGGLI